MDFTNRTTSMSPLLAYFREHGFSHDIFDSGRSIRSGFNLHGRQVDFVSQFDPNILTLMIVTASDLRVPADRVLEAVLLCNALNFGRKAGTFEISPEDGRIYHRLLTFLPDATPLSKVFARTLMSVALCSWDSSYAAFTNIIKHGWPASVAMKVGHQSDRN